MKFGIVVFPGSNGDHDAYHTLKHVMRQETEFLWHKEPSLHGSDVIVLPGGFSYGDYLRCGAIAKFSPIMPEVVRFANDGGTVIGICNGFQILCEAGLLPGALLRNACLTFVCAFVDVRVENPGTRFTSACALHDVLHMPIAHGEGNYYADQREIRSMEEKGQILFRYSDRRGAVTAGACPNGSADNIAGIMNEKGNVMGLMPHPERASDPVLGHTDGQKIFQSIIRSHILDESLHPTSVL
jgi:phosphoribosylformylglycinamidine synthase I